MANKFDKEKTRKTIEFILERLNTDADADLLNEYRAIFKKEISLTKRSWAAAYLLMQFEQGNSGRFDRNRRPQMAARPPQEFRYQDKGQSDGVGKTYEKKFENRDEPRQYPLAEEDSVRLFINIGRSRHVFPREILGFINAKVGTPREDIGSIRIMDNYSFIQVRNTAAVSIIEGLDGKSFRGKILAVNYAKSRRDEVRDGQDNYPESAGEETDYARTTEYNRAGEYAKATEYGDDYPETAAAESPEDEATDANYEAEDAGAEISEEGGFSEQAQDQSDKEEI